MNFEQWLAANKYDAAALTDAMKKHLEAAWKAEMAPAPDPDPEPTKASDFNERMAVIQAEAVRVRRIGEIAEQYATANVGDERKVNEFKAAGQAAIEDKKTSVRDFELAMLRMDRTHGPMILTPRAPQLSNEVIEAAVCRAGGLKGIETEFDAKTLEIAHSKFKSGIGLLEMLAICAGQNGFTGNVRRDLRSALRAAFIGGDQMAVGPSTLSISGILSNTANKFVRDSFNYVEQSYRAISAIRSVSDFKQITSYTLTGDLQYDKVAPDGQIHHGTLGDESYTNQADTYGKLLGISRQQWINDDLGALSQAAKRLGRGGALKLNDVFWTAFMNNSSFFSTGNGNYDDGTDTALTNDGLVAADILWRAMTDYDGKPMGHTAKIMLVPSALRVPAVRLMNSAQLLAAGEEGNVNPWAGLFEVVSSTYLSNSSYTGYSAAAWYLLCDPQDIPVIEICFLNGAEMPTIETADMDFDRLGTALRGYHDFGVAKQEPRGGYKFKGEA